MNAIAFFNNKSGVGKTSLVYHLSWMFAEKGISVLAVDLDPQANLTSMFLDEERLLALWDDDAQLTIAESLRPLVERTGDIAEPHVETLSPLVSLVPGNLSLSKFEDLLSEEWPKCLDSAPTAAFRVETAFYRVVLEAVEKTSAKVVLIDVGPNLGAINRAALVATNHVVVPLSPDLFSLQGLKNLGPSLRAWRDDWRKRLDNLPDNTRFPVPDGLMAPVGYVIMQHGVRADRPVKAYQRWMERIPSVYREAVLGDTLPPSMYPEDDPQRLALLKHYRSLMPLAMEARKPMFHLKPADGAIGAHVEAVHSCYLDFEALAREIGVRTGVQF